MKSVLIYIILFCAAPSLKGQANSFNFTFNHIAVSVRDIDRSAAFYRDVLHLAEITNRSKLEGVRWFSLGEGKELHLISIIKEEVKSNKAFHIALSTTDFSSFIKQLEARKLTYSDWPGTPNKVNIRADGIRQVFFQDPDKNWIEINSIAGKEG